MPSKVEKKRGDAGEIRLNLVLPKIHNVVWKTVREALKQALPDVKVVRYVSVAAMARAKPKGKILVPLLHPADAIALAMANAQTKPKAKVSPPEAGLSAWMADIQSVLAEKRTRRTRMVVAPLETVLNVQGVLTDALGKNIGNLVPGVAGAQASVDIGVSAIDRLVATCLLQESEAAKALLEQLGKAMICPFEAAGMSVQEALTLRDTVSAYSDQFHEVPDVVEAPEPDVIQELSPQDEEERRLLQNSLMAMMNEGDQAVANLDRSRAELKSVLEQLSEQSALAQRALAEQAALEARLVGQVKRGKLMDGSLASMFTVYEAMRDDSQSTLKHKDQEAGLLRESLQGIIAEVQTEAEKTRKERSTHRVALEEAVAEKATLTQMQAMLRKSLVAMTGELEEATWALESSRQEAQTLQGKLVAMAEDRRVLQTALGESQSESDLIQTSLRAMYTEYSQLHNQADVWRAEIQDLQDQLREQYLLRATNAALEQRVKDAETLASGRAAILAQVLLADRQQHDAHIAERRQETASAQAETATLREDLAALQAALEKAQDSAKAREAALEQDLSETRLTASENYTLLEQLSAELDHIYQSKSWKVTEPMRQVRARLRSNRP